MNLCQYLNERDSRGELDLRVDGRELDHSHRDPIGHGLRRVGGRYGGQASAEPLWRGCFVFMVTALEGIRDRGLADRVLPRTSALNY